MKRCLVIFLSLVFMALIALDGASAAQKKKALKQEIKEQVKSEQPAAPVVLSADDLQQKAKEALNKKEWVVYLKPLGEPKARPQSDTLTFYGSKVSSKRFAAKGYVESNYTIGIQPDGTTTWETMQKNDKEDIVFWKGELRGETMVGVLSFHPKKGGNEDFSFATALP